MLGGLRGYSGGSIIRPWYIPPSKSESVGPRTVKCHSKILSLEIMRFEEEKLDKLQEELHGNAPSELQAL